MRCVDLFAGCGGMSLGFINAGFEVVAAVDNWDAALSCYENNFPHPVFSLDLQDWKDATKTIGHFNPEIIIGGPPCQDFSNAGNRTEGRRAQLTVSFARIITELKPAFFVMENVERVHKSEAYKKARKILKTAGYGLTEKVLNASYCGVPQNRKRFFCVGAMNKEDGFLDGILSSNLSEIPLTVREALGNKINFEYYYRHPRTYGRRGIFSVDEPAPTIRGSNRPLPPEYKKHDNDAISPSEGVRSLTFRDRALIQTFPENFNWLDSATTNNQLIGNAVPVNLANYVAKCIMDFVNNRYDSHDVGFVDWLKMQKNYSPRAASDVLSRFRRINRIFNSNNIEIDNISSLSILEQTEDFQKCTKSVKSQLKRAYILHEEYINTCKKNGGITICQSIK